MLYTPNVIIYFILRSCIASVDDLVLSYYSIWVVRSQPEDHHCCLINDLHLSTFRWRWNCCDSYWATLYMTIKPCTHSLTYSLGLLWQTLCQRRHQHQQMLWQQLEPRLWSTSASLIKFNHTLSYIIIVGKFQFYTKQCALQIIYTIVFSASLIADIEN